MAGKLPNYLRAHRKRAGLSQAEVARLLGCRDGAKVSRYEHFRREPTLRTALTCEMIFQKPVRDLFAGISEQVERDARRRAKFLARRIAARTQSPAVVRKIVVLRGIADPPPEDLRYEPVKEV
jgi:transcriptional regulator with XRE-family HTH domain